MQGGIPVVVLRVHVGPGSHQQLYEAVVATPRGSTVQGRVALISPGLDLGSGLDEKTRDVEPTRPGHCEMERSVPELGLDRQTGAGVHEQADHVYLLALYGRMKSGLAANVTSAKVDLGTVAQQQLGDIVPAAQAGPEQGRPFFGLKGS